VSPRRALITGVTGQDGSSSRPFRAQLNARETAHRRGGYRDPESQALIEPWFSS